MSRMRSTPIGLAQRIDGWREEGRRAERERIIDWLGRVGESLNEEPVREDDEEPTDENDTRLTRSERIGASGIIVVLIDNLKAER